MDLTSSASVQGFFVGLGLLISWLYESLHAAHRRFSLRSDPRSLVIWSPTKPKFRIAKEGRDGSARLILPICARTEVFVALLPTSTTSPRVAERKYQRSLLQAITDNAQTSIFLMDEVGRGLFVNPAAEEMTGYSASELIGNRLSQVIHRSPDPQTLHSNGDLPLLGHGASIEPVRNQTDIFVHRDGRAYPVLWNARAVFRDG